MRGNASVGRHRSRLVWRYTNRRPVSKGTVVRQGLAVHSLHTDSWHESDTCDDSQCSLILYVFVRTADRFTKGGMSKWKTCNIGSHNIIYVKKTTVLNTLALMTMTATRDMLSQISIPFENVYWRSFILYIITQKRTWYTLPLTVLYKSTHWRILIKSLPITYYAIRQLHAITCYSAHIAINWPAWNNIFRECVKNELYFSGNV